MLEERFIRDVESLSRRGKPITVRQFDYLKREPEVPPALAHIWKLFGISIWADGAFQICETDLYKSNVDDVFEGHELIDASRVTPFVISAFGFMKVWHPEFGVFEVQFPLSCIIFPLNPQKLREKPVGDTNLIARFPTSEGDFPTIKGFAEARKRIGKLQENEVYGFVPSLASGGSINTSRAQRFQADVHLSILAGMQPFRTYFFDSSGPGGYAEI